MHIYLLVGDVDEWIPTEDERIDELKDSNKFYLKDGNKYWIYNKSKATKSDIGYSGMLD